MSDTVHPCIVQLVPRQPSRNRGKPQFSDAADFANECLAVRVFACGESETEVMANAHDAIIAAIGLRRAMRYCMMVTPFIPDVDPEWDHSYLVEDWGGGDADGSEPRLVKRFWVHAPTPELAAWSARAELAASCKRVARLISDGGPLAGDPVLSSIRMGVRTLVHDYSNCRGLVAPSYDRADFLDAYRLAQLKVVMGLEEKGSSIIDRKVARYLDQAPDGGDGREALLGMVRHQPSAFRLRAIGATAEHVARELAFEDVCDNYATSIYGVDDLLDRKTAIFTGIHRHLCRPIGPNLVDIGPAEVSDPGDFAEAMRNSSLVSVIDHKDGGGS